MAKKKMILYGAAVLFAVSGIVAVPSGNVTGGVGCLVIAALCAFFEKNGQAAQQEKSTVVQKDTAASGSKIIETIRTKVVGVTFDNEDGENRQDILSTMTGDEDITVEKYTYVYIDRSSKKYHSKPTCKNIQLVRNAANEA